jgi:cell division septation protein DedD
MAGATHDDGFHEIQLNGKQLVFLFMAVTVVSVVIFLCGVLVGRGVRLDRGGPIETVEASSPTDTPPPPPVEGGGNSSEPVASNEVTTFTKRLESPTPQAEKLAPADAPVPRPEKVAEAPPAPAPPTPPAATPAPAATAPAAAPPPAKAAVPAGPPEPSGPGVAVQVSAFRVRQEADALAARLIGKGYTAYVVPPAPGAPALFRVRVGKFKEQREANQVAAKLKKEEQFDPWIVR